MRGRGAFEGGFSVNKYEKAELAFRIAGVAFLVDSVLYLPSWVSFLAGHIREYSLGTAMGVLNVYGTPIVCGALGTLLFLLSRRFARWVAGSEVVSFDPPQEANVHIGVLLLGMICLMWASSLLLSIGALSIFAVSQGGVRRLWEAYHARMTGLMTLQALLGTGICAYLLTCPRHLRSFLARRASVGEAAPRAIELLALGLVLMGTMIAFQQAWNAFIGAVNLCAAATGSFAGHRVWLGHWLRLAGFGLGLAAAVALVLFAGKLARRLGGAPGGSGPELPLPGRRSLFYLALLAGSLYLMLAGASQVPPRYGDPTRLLGVGLLAALGAALLTCCLIWGRRFAANLYPEEPADEVQRRDSERLVLEVALGAIALHLAFGWVAPGKDFRTIPDSMLAPALLVIVALFRCDLAWLLVGGRSKGTALDRPQRAQALQPCLVLLGAWLVLVNASELPMALSIATTGTQSVAAEQTPHLGPPLYATSRRLVALLVVAIQTPYASAGAGLIVMLWARPISRLLSHGRIIPRVFPPYPGS